MSYYLKVGDVFYFLDSTSSISVKYPGDISSHPTADRKVASDNYILDEPTCTISGIITDIKTPRAFSDLSTGQFIDGLLLARDQKVPVFLKHRLDKEEDPNWFITDFTPSQSVKNGFGGVSGDGAVTQSFRVDLKLKKINFATASTANVNVSAAYFDAVQAKEKKSSSTQSPEDSEDGLRRSAILKKKMEDFAQTGAINVGQGIIGQEIEVQ